MLNVKEDFQLLTLPEVPLLACLERMDPGQLINLSFISPQVERLARYVNWPAASGFLDFRKGITICFDGASDFMSCNIENNENLDRSLKYYIDYFSRLFALRLEHVLFHSKNFEENWKWFEDRQDSVKTIRVKDFNVTENQLETVVRTITQKSKKDTGGVVFDMTTLPNIRYPGIFKFESPPEMLHINSSSWFSLENLIDGACMYMSINDSWMTDEECNQLLRTWVNDGLKHLKYLSLNRLNPNVNECVIIGGLDAVEVDDVRRHTVTFSDGASAYTCIHDGYDLRRADGTIATIVMRDDSDGRGAHSLIICVW